MIDLTDTNSTSIKNTGLVDLSDTTFIIPLFLESEDRKVNAEITLSYLCKHLKTNIIQNIAVMG